VFESVYVCVNSNFVFLVLFICRAAAKVVSYVAAGPSSSEDEHHLGRDSEGEQGSAAESTGSGAGKGKGTRGGRGGSVSGSESEGWEDTSEVESSSSEGSDVASGDSDEEGVGSESALGDVVGSGGKKSSGSRGKGSKGSATRVRSGGAAGNKLVGVKVKKSREPGNDSGRAVWTDELVCC